MRSWHNLALDGVGTNNEGTAGVNISNPPPAPVTLSFQQGVNGYSGTVDTFIEQDRVTTTHGSNSQFEWDDGNNNDESSLLRFEDIFGPGPDQIPPGSTIASATLTYRVNNSGDLALVHDSVADWDESTTYSSFDSVSGLQGLAAPVANAPGSSGFQTTDVTASLNAWSADPSSNRGWVLTPSGTNGVVVRSSEYSSVSQRPMLTVEYSLVSNDLAITQVTP